MSVRQAEAELDALGRGLQAADGKGPWTRNMRIIPLHEAMFGPIRRQSMVLFAAAALVLLLAIVNLANLLLARGSWRERELAIRASLGAGRGRLVRQLLVEGVLLSSAGGLIGLVLAWSTFDALYARVPSRLFAALPSGVDRRVLVFTIALSVVTGLASAVLPALRLTGAHLTRALQDGRRPRAVSTGRNKRGAVLVVTQMALVVVILTSAGLMLNSLVRALRMDLGVRIENVVQISTAPPPQVMKSPTAAVAYYRDVASRVRAVPGVKRVAGVCSLTIGGTSAPWQGMMQEGPPENRGARYLVTAEYFSVLGIRILSGRGFTDREIESAAPVAVVSDTAARRLWPGEPPVGRQFRTGDEPPREVIGVVADTRDAFSRPVVPVLYLPLDQERARPIDLVALVDGDPSAAATAIRTSLDTPGSRKVVEALADTIHKTTVAERFQTLLLALFAALALLLAAVGIAGIVGYTVARRTREMGIRVALGSTPHGIVLLIIRQSLTLVVVGAVVGLCGALAATRVLTGLLFQVKPNDATTFGIAVGALLLVGGLASLLPALRAARVDPVVPANRRRSSAPVPVPGSVPLLTGCADSFCRNGPLRRRRIRSPSTRARFRHSARSWNSDRRMPPRRRPVQFRLQRA